MSVGDLLSRLSLVFVIDGNVYGEQSQAAARLRELEGQRWVLLQSTSSILDELEATPSDEKREAMLAESLARPSDFDAGVWAPGKWDRTVRAGPADTDRIDQIWRVVKPGVDRDEARPSHLRDVIALNTAIRYARSGFVTRDGQMLSKAAAVKEAFNGFLLLSPEECVELVEARISTHKRLLDQ